MLHAIRNHPLLKTTLSRGEEHVNRVVGRILSDEKAVSHLHTLADSAQAVKGHTERQIKRILSAFGIASADELAALRERLAQIEMALEAITGVSEPKSGSEEGSTGEPPSSFRSG